MESDTEDDFPLNGGRYVLYIYIYIYFKILWARSYNFQCFSDKLAKLFEDNTLDDISFKFSLPKHPSKRPTKPTENTLPLKVIHGKTVEAFQL